MASLLKQITPEDVASFAYDPVDAAALKDATAIVTDVREQGEQALHKHAARLGDVPSEDAPLLVEKKQLQAAYEALPEAQQQVLQRTTQRVKAFAQAQRASIGNFEQKIEGGFAGQDVRLQSISDGWEA
jgi:histidinol dehydrogenase